MHIAFCNFQLIMSKFEFNVYEKAEDIIKDVEELTERLEDLTKALLKLDDE